MFFEANGIVEPSGTGAAEIATWAEVQRRKRAVCFAEARVKVFTTLSNLLAPDKPKDKPLKDIVDVLKTLQFNAIGNHRKFTFRNKKATSR